jgi:hypothetical protein
MRLQTLLVLLVGFNVSQFVFAASLCPLLLTGQHVGTPLVTLSSVRYSEMRTEIVNAYKEEVRREQQYSEKIGLLYLENHYPHINVSRAPGFEIDYYSKRTEDETNESQSWGPRLINEYGVLRIATTSQEWLNFLASAIYEDDLTKLLREVKAYKVQLIFYVPEISLKPVELNLTPVSYQYEAGLDGSRPRFTAIEQRTPGSSTVVWGRNSEEVFEAITSPYSFAGRTALPYLSARLGFSLDRVIRSAFIKREAEEILRGLGYSHSPSLQSEGYWQAREVNNRSPVYRKAIAALVKMNELDLVYADTRLRAGSSEFKTGLISRAEYERTWGAMVGGTSYLTGGHYKAVDGVKIYEGLAAAIQELEGRGYRYVEGQGFVSP